MHIYFRVQSLNERASRAMPGYVQTWFTRTFLPCGSYHKNVWEHDMSKQHLHILDIAEKKQV